MTSLGYVFPGQGSQSVGMLADIAREFKEVSDVFSESSEALGYDLWKLVQEGPAELLDQTVHTQPAILAGSYALWQIISKRKNQTPAMLAGHSLGEYTALVCAKSLTFRDAIRLVATRGQLMQDAVPEGLGGLAAIVGLENDAVFALCEEAKQPDEVLTPANFNSPGQVVIAGHLKAVERAMALAKTSGARIVKLLPVSVPSHSLLMKTAADQLAMTLASLTINTPTLPVLNNVDVQFYTDAESIRQGLVRQLYMPVRWVEIINTFAKKGITHIVECGPGKVLTGLNKRITDIHLTPTGDLVNLQAELTRTFATE